MKLRERDTYFRYSIKAGGSRSLLLFLLGILFFGSSQAQLRDSARLDTTRYQLTVNATGSLNQANNINTYLFNNGVKLSAIHRLFTANFNASYVYGLSENNITNNDFFTSLDGNFNKERSRLFYWVLLNYTSSFSLKINGLFQGGAGAAYTLIKNERNFLNLSDGIIYEKDDLYRDTLHDIYHTYRNSFRLQFKWTIVNHVVFEGNNFIQNSFEYGKDYILKSNLGLSVNLNKWLSLTTTFVFNRFNRTGQQNLLLTYGMKIDKQF